MSGWTIAWICWIAVFLLAEGVALFNKRTEDTLSETAWRWFHVHDPHPGPWYITLRCLLAVFLVWLAGHLVMGWWTPTHPWPGH